MRLVDLLIYPKRILYTIIDLLINLLKAMSKSHELAPFPENLLVVPLTVISYAKLAAADPEEGRKLFQASKELGFFYLDLQHASEMEETLLSDVDSLFDMAPQFFAVPQEEKEKYDLTKNNGHG
jgi:hypothetical protein